MVGVNVTCYNPDSTLSVPVSQENVCIHHFKIFCSREGFNGITFATISINPLMIVVVHSPYMIDILDLISLCQIIFLTHENTYMVTLFLWRNKQIK